MTAPRHLLAATAAGVLVLAACFPPMRSTPLPEVGEATAATAAARVPGATAEQVARGRAVMAGHCGECHGMPDVRSESLEEWRDEIIPRMAKKAKLDAADTAALTAYVLGARG